MSRVSIICEIFEEQEACTVQIPTDERDESYRVQNFRRSWPSATFCGCVELVLRGKKSLPNICNLERSAAHL